MDRGSQIYLQHLRLYSRRKKISKSKILRKTKIYIKGKPNSEGLKNFVLADTNGLVLDFFIYQGKKTTIDHDDCEFSLTLAESVVWHLSETVPPKTCLYFDRYFTTEK